MESRPVNALKIDLEVFASVIRKEGVWIRKEETKVSLITNEFLWSYSAEQNLLEFGI